MTMVLEYPFKVFILIVVVLVIISIMWQFRDKIMNICLFPPCNGEEECNVQPVITTESEFTKEVLDKYCSLCWIKNGAGKCRGDSICYVLNLNESFIPDNWNLIKEHEYCIVTCENETSSLFVQYYSEGEGYIEIAC